MRCIRDGSVVHDIYEWLWWRCRNRFSTERRESKILTVRMYRIDGGCGEATCRARWTNNDEKMWSTLLNSFAMVHFSQSFNVERTALKSAVEQKHTQNTICSDLCAPWIIFIVYWFSYFNRPFNDKPKHFLCPLQRVSHRRDREANGQKMIEWRQMTKLELSANIENRFIVIRNLLRVINGQIIFFFSPHRRIFVACQRQRERKRDGNGGPYSCEQRTHASIQTMWRSFDLVDVNLSFARQNYDAQYGRSGWLMITNDNASSNPWRGARWDWYVWGARIMQ